LSKNSKVEVNEPVKFEFKKRTSRVDSINSRYSKNSEGSPDKPLLEIKPGGTPIFSPVQKGSMLFGKTINSNKYEEYMDDEPVYAS
jgi:hypothetical protein